MKPTQETLKYYDWTRAWAYLEKEHGLKMVISKQDYPEDRAEYFSVWVYIAEKYGISNGSFFTLTDWDLKNGFEDTLPKFWVPVLKIIMEEFGEEDYNCRVAKFRADW